MPSLTIEKRSPGPLPHRMLIQSSLVLAHSSEIIYIIDGVTNRKAVQNITCQYVSDQINAGKQQKTTILLLTRLSFKWLFVMLL